MTMHINRFLDKMAVMESKQNKDVVLPISDARGLRDDITRLLSELFELQKQKGSDDSQEVIQVEIKGGTFKCDQIVEAAGIWAVFYDDQPINLKSSHHLTNDIAPKYKKTSFSNPGHARNLCRKLNAQFKTDKFTVVFMNGGRIVYPDDLSQDQI